MLCLSGFHSIFSLSAPVLKIVVFNPLAILFLSGKNIFLLACDTVLHNYDRFRIDVQYWALFATILKVVVFNSVVQS